MTTPPTSGSAGSAGNVSSPEATAGSGTTFESRVAAIALARLLSGDRLPGLDVPVVAVRLQQRVAGALLDDIVVSGLETGGTVRTIEYQIKRSLSPAPGNQEFVEIIGQILDVVQKNGDGLAATAVDRGLRRFGVAARPSGSLKHLARVTVVARSHNAADTFLQVVQQTANAEVKRLHKQLRETVSKIMIPKASDGVPAAGPAAVVVDDATWRVARSRGTGVSCGEREADGGRGPPAGRLAAA